MSETSLSLIAPLSGPLVPLERVPDPVFAGKMVGDGISIDPVNQCLIAPCDGKVVQLHRANHAVTIEASNGLQIMMHIGIDTVSLDGVGFVAKVAMGDSVKTGDPMIEFDADFVATKAKSLLTQILIINSDQVAEFKRAEGFVEAGKQEILTLKLVSGENSADNSEHDAISSDPIAIPNPTGLHARPASLLVAEAKKFSSTIHLYKGSDHANAKSLVSIMGLEVNCGDKLTVVAAGSDAEAAIAKLAPMLASGLGEDCPPLGESPVEPHAQVVEEEEPSEPKDPNRIIGVTASPGLAVGKIYQLKREEISVEEKGESKSAEQEKLDNALKQAFKQLQELEAKVEDPDKAAIFAAHQNLLDDPELTENANDMIADGKSAAYAWKAAYTSQAKSLSRLKNQLLAARANDLRDVGRRVLQLILGLDVEEDDIPEGSILIAEDLTPSDTANLDREKVYGFCTLTGGASSHVAILARSMNIPAIAGAESRALSLANGTPVILDADSGTLQISPDDAEIARIKTAQQAQAKKHEEDLANAKKPATTQDDHHLAVVANIANDADAKQAAELGGEGVGLLRSEFLFMNRATAPSEDEQTEAYEKILAELGPDQPLIIRTLDVGGDKPLPYLPIAAEENPFLGLRGIRVSLQRKSLFRTQLRAILRASKKGNVHIMFPMVTTIEDLRQGKALVEEEREKLGIDSVPVGIMVEVPSTAVMAEQFAAEADFFSIGTNDLTQYTLAIDRGHPVLAAQADGLNPAVLQMISMTVKGAHKHGKWVGVCGGIASDEIAVPVLIGLGVDELSVSVPSIPGVKAKVRESSLAECQKLAEKALQQDSAASVRKLVNEFKK